MSSLPPDPRPWAFSPLLTRALCSSPPSLLHLFSSQQESASCLKAFSSPCGIDRASSVLRESLEGFFPLSILSFLVLTLATLPSCCTPLDTSTPSNLAATLVSIGLSLLASRILKHRAAKIFRFLSHIPNFVPVIVKLAHNSLRKQVLQSRNQSWGNLRGQMSTLKQILGID